MTAFSKRHNSVSSFEGLTMIRLDHAGDVETKKNGKYVRPNVFEYKIEPGIAELCIFNPYYYNEAKKDMLNWGEDVARNMYEKDVHAEDAYNNQVILNSEHDHSMHSDDDWFGEMCGRIHVTFFGTLRKLNLRNLNNLSTPNVSR